MPSLNGGPDEPGVLARVSTFLGFFRWVFMPLGLFALVAVGVHAAADTLDDRLLWVVDRLDAWLDGVLGAWAATASWVDLIGSEQRTLVARSLALLWELAADAVLALPALGYREQERAALEHRLTFTRRPDSWRELGAKILLEPTLLRAVRPLATAAVVVAGACAIARMAQGALFLSMRQGVLGEGVAGPAARLLAVAALAAVLATFGWRAVLRNLQHADRLSQERVRGRVQALTVGLPGSAVVIPLALAAVLDAAPLLSFFR